MKIKIYIFITIMPYKNWKITLSSADKLSLDKLTNARTSSKSDSQRALILLKLSNGESPSDIAKDIGCCFDTVTKCYSKLRQSRKIIRHQTYMQH